MFIDILKQVTMLVKILTKSYLLVEATDQADKVISWTLSTSSLPCDRELANNICKSTAIAFSLNFTIAPNILKIGFMYPNTKQGISWKLGIYIKPIANTFYNNLLDVLYERIDSNDLDFCISRNEFFSSRSDYIKASMDHIFQNREKNDIDFPFSDYYISREPAVFWRTNDPDSYNYVILNIERLQKCVNEDIDSNNQYLVQDRPWPKIFFSWPHLLYAYLIENTRAYEIFHRIINEFRHGEKLGTPSSSNSQNWLLNTEQMFYADPPSFTAYSLTSYIRPDLRATRRNAYYRMFGMDLNHGTDDNRPYNFIKPGIANTAFVGTFEEFLKEVWVAIENANNVSGSNPADEGKINDLAARLHNMLNARRENGNLSREEFFAVATMSWLHLTLLYDSDIVKELRANSQTPDQRLSIISDRLGMPVYGKSYHFFQLADCISTIMYPLEAGWFDDSRVRLLYPPGTNTNVYAEAIKVIITNWSSATGRDMKAKSISATRTRT